MNLFTKCVFITNVLVIWFAVQISSDKPCAARRTTEGDSVVCVCNDDYCDEITREPVSETTFYAYTSNKAGLRFAKSRPDFNASSCCPTIIELDPDTTYQEVIGFGGAVTDAVGIHWTNLSETLRNYFISSYFGEKGIEYNIIRVPIGGSDFSTHAYAYNELPENDTFLSNFSLTYEDEVYKIPLIKAMVNMSPSPVNIVATTWSPPIWMKTNHDYYGFSRLKTEYYQTYADYHYKFLEKYADQGIKVWAISTTNEPVNGVVPIARFNSLGWTPKEMGIWITENLGPTIKNSTFSDIKILAVDDQRYSIPLWFNVMVQDHPKALDYIDGVAVHFYGDFITPASILSDVGRNFPGKFVIATEACEGSYPWQLKKVVLGSWSRARTYVMDILEDLNHDVVGWIDWNMALDIKGGPNWSGNHVDSPVIVFAENKEFVKQPMFYIMGHFSKFIPRGSKRIATTEQTGLFSSSVQNVAFITPRKTIVVVLYNDGGARSVGIKLGHRLMKIDMDADSIMTLELPYDNTCNM